MNKRADKIAKHLDAEGCNWRAKLRGMTEAAQDALLEIAQDANVPAADRVAAAHTLLTYLR